MFEAGSGFGIEALQGFRIRFSVCEAGFRVWDVGL